MGEIQTLGFKAFRDFLLDGVPGSGANEPVKQEIRDFVEAVDTSVVSLGAGRKGYATVADMNADLLPEAGTIGEVLSDVVGTTTLRARSGNVATLTLAAPTGLAIGNVVNVRNMPAAYNGRVTVTATPTGSSFSYASVASNETSTADTNGIVDRNGIFLKVGASGAGSWVYQQDNATSSAAFQQYTADLSAGLVPLATPRIDTIVAPNGLAPTSTLLGLSGLARSKVLTHIYSGLPRRDTYTAPLPTSTLTQTNAAPLVITEHSQRIVCLNANNAEADFSYAYDGQENVVYALQPATIYIGAANNILGVSTSHDEIVMPANTAVRILKTVNHMIVTPITGAMPVTRVRSTSVVRTRSILHAGQSNARRLVGNGGVGGIATGLRDLATPIVDSMFHIEGATPGSSLMATSATYWWNHLTNTMGPAFTACLAALDAALSAGQPFPSAVLWDQGESDVPYLEDGSATYAAFVACLTSFVAKLQAELTTRGAPGNIPIIVCMIGSRDARTSEFRGASAVRMGYFEVMGATAYMHLGASKYDIARPIEGEVHLNEVGYYELGRRVARVIANVLYGQANNLGPVFTSASLSGDLTRATLTIGHAAATYFRPDNPMMFGVLPAGGNPQSHSFVPITSATWDGSGRLVLQTSGNLLGGRILYPTGYGEDPNPYGGTWRENQIFRDTAGLPMRSFLSPALA